MKHWLDFKGQETDLQTDQKTHEVKMNVKAFCLDGTEQGANVRHQSLFANQQTDRQAGIFFLVYKKTAQLRTGQAMDRR